MFLPLTSATLALIFIFLQAKALGQSGFYIIELPTSLSRKPGQDLYLSALPASKRPDITYRWLWNGSTNLPASTQTLGTSLFLPFLAITNAGEYALIAVDGGQTPLATNKCTVNVVPNAPGPSGFDGFAANSGRWSGIYGLGGTNGICSGDSFWEVSGGFLNLRMTNRTPTGDTGTSYLWDYQMPGNRNWEVTVTATITTNLSMSSGLDFFELRLGCSIPESRTVAGGPRCGLGISFAVQPNKRFLMGHVETTGAPEPNHTNPTNISTTSVELKLVYTNQVLQAFHRIPPSSFWNLLETNPVSGVVLSNGFQVELVGYATRSFAVTSGNACFDNFKASVSLPVFFGNHGVTNIASDGFSHLMKYAYGAASPTNLINPLLLPSASIKTNREGQPMLTLSYYARTDDPDLMLQPCWSTNIATLAEAWSTNVQVTSLGMLNTNGLALEWREAAIPMDSHPRKFLRLKTILNQ